MGKVTELIVDAYGCAANLEAVPALEAACERAVKSVGAQVATKAMHRFQPHGTTLCLVLMESHFVISTWPEHGLAIANIFLCNDSMNPLDVWNELEKYLKPQEVKIHEVPHQIRAVRLAA